MLIGAREIQRDDTPISLRLLKFACKPISLSSTKASCNLVSYNWNLYK